MRALWLIIAAMLGTLAWTFWPPAPAYPHDAPSGWTYPFSCCSGFDCRPVSPGAVRESGDGYVVPSGEALAASDDRVKDSPDGEYHWCSQGGAETGRTICLFVPPRLF